MCSQLSGRYRPPAAFRLRSVDGTRWKPPATAREVAELMRLWLDVDEPLVEAVGNTTAEYHRVDSQELARRVVATVIQVLEDNLR